MVTMAAVEASLERVYEEPWSSSTSGLLYGPPGHEGSSDVRDAYEAIRSSSVYSPMPELVPLAVIDERSVACTVIVPVPGLALEVGDVVRWHLDDVPMGKQAQLIDVDPYLYIKSIDEELRARDKGLKRVLDQIGPAYDESHLAPQRRPRDHVVRPVRIACQNVVVGLAAFAQESGFDGLSVVAWQTCEVPHVAAHEANRALAALMLCDAFRNGGTMEIRFDRQAHVTLGGKRLSFPGHPEGRVPASLRRYGRTVGVHLGAADPAAIYPEEARALFLAVTPMVPDLRARASAAMGSGLSPERLCYALLSQTWREIELDFLLGVSARSASILEGGAGWEDRRARQAEAELCRGALMAGMLHRRLDTTDDAASGTSVRLVEDRRVGVTWTVDPEHGAIHFAGLRSDEALPWRAGSATAIDGRLSIVPRSLVTPDCIELVQRLANDGPAALVVPGDLVLPALPPDVLVLRCPDRRPDLDKAIEEKLLTARISRG